MQPEITPTPQDQQKQNAEPTYRLLSEMSEGARRSVAESVERLHQAGRTEQAQDRAQERQRSLDGGDINLVRPPQAPVFDPVVLSPRFDQALGYASTVHAGQTRKGTSIPYIAHVLAVAGIVLENGGNEDEAIAALLHDAGEDAGGQDRINDIRSRFGNEVAEIVEACSDTLTTPKPPWRKRKLDYIAHLPSVSPSIRLVVASDKLHNVRSLTSDCRVLGDALWSRFNATKDESLWFYRAVTDGLRLGGTNPLVEELDRSVKELEHVAHSEQLPRLPDKKLLKKDRSQEMLDSLNKSALEDAELDARTGHR